MIHQTKLSLGDYVKYKSQICVVERLSSFHATIKPIAENNAPGEQHSLICADYEDLSHVRISERILQRLGFTLDGNDAIYKDTELSTRYNPKNYKRAVSFVDKNVGVFHGYCYHLDTLQHIARMFNIELKFD